MTTPGEPIELGPDAKELQAAILKLLNERDEARRQRNNAYCSIAGLIVGFLALHIVHL